jgi:hypothetical protein
VAVNLKGSTTRAAESHLRAHVVPTLGSAQVIGDEQRTVVQIGRLGR